MAERVLLVGGGGREHAIARAVAASDEPVSLFACAGNRNPGIATVASGFRALDTTDPEAVCAYAEEVGASIAVIGPEAPLAAGVSDALRAEGVFPFGPSAAAARIETDKAWQRRFMQDNGITGTPDFEVFDTAAAAAEYVTNYDGEVAVKPTGLTGGKGVRVTGDQLTKEAAAEYVIESDYEEWVVEERLVGEEFTLQTLVANGDVRPTPAVQDHKRAYEGDTGPNTGGMGSYSDAVETLPFMEQADYDAALQIVEETVAALPEYTGVLYGQFMLTSEGPKVVEFNARFGDPEAMNTLPVLRTDFLDVLTAARDGNDLPDLSFAEQATVCKYAVPEGYPTDPQGGTLIEIDESSAGEALLFYASVDDRDDGIYTTTSRSFAVVGIADTIAAAEEIAEEAITAAGEEGLRVRHDIGTADLVQRRIDHMADLRGS